MSRRAALLLGAVAVLTTPAVLAGHAVVHPARSTPGAYERYVLRVPNERPVPTTRVEISFPAEVTVVSFGEVPRWALEARRAPDGRITGAVWSGEIGVERFVEFPFIAVNPRDEATLEWRATQTYANGEVVHWEGPEGSERPASFTTVSQDGRAAGRMPLALGAAALALALLALGLALRRSPAAGTAALALVLIAAAGCRDEGEDTAADVARGTNAAVARRDLGGVQLTDPLEKPAVVLTDASGRPFDLRRQTAGYATLLFFGYTHCPDVCPVTMTNLAAVLQRLPVGVRRQIKVVFVTTDPERDTPQRLRSWLAEHDPSFVGLWAPLDEVNGLLARLDLPPAGVPRPAADSARGPAAESDADYAVVHPAQVVAWSADEKRTVLYPFGTRQSEWARDLPRLAAPAAGAADRPAS